MIARRAFLQAGTAFTLLGAARAQGPSRLSFGGSLEQGGLVICRAPAGAHVTVDDRRVLVSPKGIFTIGLPYDASKPVRVQAQFVDGSSETREVVAKVRHYTTQSISGLPKKYVEPPPDIMKRILHERRLIWNVRKHETDGTDFVNPLEWPFAGIISSPYGNRRILDGKPMAPHLGIDIAAPEGTPIHAAADAVVTISGDFYLEGGLTFLDHGHGVQTCYLHQSKRKVAVGDVVKRGQVIGLVGQTGRATGPHTHWGLSWFQVKLDPSLSTRTPEPPRA